MIPNQTIDVEACPLFKAAIDADYPIPDSQHGSVVMRATDNRAAFRKGWLAAKRSIAQAPASEAVAVPVWELFADGWDGVDDLDGDWMQTLPIGTKLYYLSTKFTEQQIADAERNGAVLFAALCVDETPAAQPAADPAPVPAKPGTQFSYACASCYGSGIDVAGKPCACNCLHSVHHQFAAQGIDHAATSAMFAAIHRNRERFSAEKVAAAMGAVPQIDHAKRVEGERAAFEVWFMRDRSMRIPPARASDHASVEDGRDYEGNAVECCWQGWQARGQQAGGAEVREVLQRCAGWSDIVTRWQISDETAAKFAELRDDCKALLAAAPGEAG